MILTFLIDEHKLGRSSKLPMSSISIPFSASSTIITFSEGCFCSNILSILHIYIYISISLSIYIIYIYIYILNIYVHVYIIYIYIYIYIYILVRKRFVKSRNITKILRMSFRWIYVQDISKKKHIKLVYIHICICSYTYIYLNQCSYETLSIF